MSQIVDKNKKRLKTALIHDWLDMYGGSERIIASISELYDFDYYYAYVNKMSEENLLKTFAGKSVNIEDAKIFRPFKYVFRYLMPFFPNLIRSFNKQTKDNEVDVVISSCSVMSKGYRIGNEIHISYLHCRNFKYVWDEAYLYFKGPLKLLSFIKKPLQQNDIKFGKNPDYLIVNSKFVKEWVKKKYKRDSKVIYPPVDVEDFYISNQKEDYYVAVGRTVPCKRFEIIIEAFNKNQKKLIIVGDGWGKKQLEKIAKSNIDFVGFKTKDELKEILAKAKAFVFAAEEDFGIAIVEALSAGLPVIAYQGGASKELISEDSGLLYPEQTADSLNESIRSFEENEQAYQPKKIRESAMKFSKNRFKEEISAYIDQILQKGHVKNV